jgi:hypothetical protein
VTPVLIAHIYGVPLEELLAGATAGGGAIWFAARIYVSNLADRAKR